MNNQNTNKNKEKIYIPELIGKIFFSCILIVMIVTAIAFFLMYLLGVQVHCAKDNSMNPDIPENSLVLVSKTIPSSIEKGTNITYVIDQKGTLKTGRVTENDTMRQKLTVADNFNQNIDVIYGNTIGTAVYAVPVVGSVYEFIISEENRGTLIIIAFFLVGSSLAFEIIIKHRKSKM